jgi:hypothetical protein
MAQANLSADEGWSETVRVAGCRMAPIAVLILIGCNGGSSISGSGASPPAQSTTKVASTAKQFPSARTLTQPGSSEGDSSTSFETRAPVRTDSQGRKFLGDVPYDVFFDNPLAVAAEGGPVSDGGNNSALAATSAKSSANHKTSNSAAGGPPPKSPASAEKTEGAAQNDWSRLVEMDVLDAEVKRIRNELAAQLQSVGKYNSHYQEIAVAGATLAVVAEIVAEHAGSVSWKNNAPLIRDLGMKIHDAASAPGSTASQATKTPYEQVVDVLDGNVPSGVAASQPRRDFSEVASRDAIMKRMDHSFQWLKKSGSAQQVLRKQSAEAIHESSLLAALGRVIAAGHYDSADDAKYKTHASELSKSAAAVAAAVKSEDAAAFTDAVGRVQKRCDACHADFRFQ